MGWMTYLLGAFALLGIAIGLRALFRNGFPKTQCPICTSQEYEIVGSSFQLQSDSTNLNVQVRCSRGHVWNIPSF